MIPNLLHQQNIENESCSMYVQTCYYITSLTNGRFQKKPVFEKILNFMVTKRLFDHEKKNKEAAIIIQINKNER